jgi:hypothetical protein
MNERNIVTLAVPSSMLEALRQASAEDGTTVERFVLLAVSDKLASWRSFAALRAGGGRGALARVLDPKRRGAKPRRGDEIPRGRARPGGVRKRRSA